MVDLQMHEIGHGGIVGLLVEQAVEMRFRIAHVRGHVVDGQAVLDVLVHIVCGTTDERYVLGLDVGGTNLVAGVIDEQYQIVARCSRPAGAGRRIVC